MPTRYVIDKERRLIISSGWDRVSYQDILAHRIRLKADPDFDPSYNQLVDGRAVTTLDLSIEEAKSIASTSPFSSTSRRAFVATDFTILGIARLAEAYSGAAKGREEVRVFHSLTILCGNRGIQSGLLTTSPIQKLVRTPGLSGFGRQSTNESSTS